MKEDISSFKLKMCKMIINNKNIEERNLNMKTVSLINQYKEALEKSNKEKKELELQMKQLKQQINIIPKFIWRIYARKLKRITN